jgi:predicted nucleic acid-binding protein
MQKSIVSDASCIIILSNVSQLSILHKLFEVVIVTQVVAEEYGQRLPEWVEVQYLEKSDFHYLQTQLDEGEASSIALASKLKDALLIIDERKGRRIARELQIDITGTLGILLLAKQKGLIAKLKPVLQEIQKTNFRISEQLIKQTLILAGEH